MSGIKSSHLTEFYRRLHARGQTVAALAQTVFSSRSHVTQVLNGSRPGKATWRKLARVLHPDDLALLPHRPVPRGALSQVKHETST